MTCTNCQKPRQLTSVVKFTIPMRPDAQAHLCRECFENSVILEPQDGPYAGKQVSWYTPQPYQRPYHESNTPNFLALGTRDTGKSKAARADAIIRCMKYAGYKVLIIRRKMPDLRKSHLQFIGAEMAMLGDEVGYYRESTFDVKFANGSIIQFSHCVKMKDVEDYLSSAWDLIIFDEVSTFPLQMFLTISAAARSAKNAPWCALVRALSNTLGIGAKWMQEWFINKNVDRGEYPDYDPDDFDMYFSSLDQNQYADKAAYEKRLKVLPDHIRRAWLKGEFVTEGAYFTKFAPLKDDQPWHVIDSLPLWQNRNGAYVPFLSLLWISIYRSVDWGFSPDPAVCLWTAVLPDGHEIVFKEKSWKGVLARDVAKDIVSESEGMHVAETYADPSMFSKGGESEYSIAEQFEMNGVPLVASQNDRKLFGYVVCEHLYTEQTIERNGRTASRPKMQILEWDGQYGCPNLIRTIPMQVMDANDPKKLAAGEDHWVVALAYFAMGRATPAEDPQRSSTPYWMQSRKQQRRSFRVVR